MQSIYQFREVLKGAYDDVFEDNDPALREIWIKIVEELKEWRTKP